MFPRSSGDSQPHGSTAYTKLLRHGDYFPVLEFSLAQGVHYIFRQFCIPIHRSRPAAWEPKAVFVCMQTVFGWSSPFKVFYSVITSVAIFMVHLLADFWQPQKSGGYESMHPMKRDLSVLAKNNLEVSVSFNEFANAVLRASRRFAKTHNPALIGGCV